MTPKLMRKWTRVGTHTLIQAPSHAQGQDTNMDMDKPMRKTTADETTIHKFRHAWQTHTFLAKNHQDLCNPILLHHDASRAHMRAHGG